MENNKLNKYLLYVSAITIIALISFILISSEKNKNTPDIQIPDKIKKEEKTVERNNLIRITKPAPGDAISSPLEISGEARGTWYFEASFPIIAVDNKGQEIGSAIATAQGDWMTEEFVPFKATLNFNSRGATEGKIIFKKDNPSDMRELDDSFEIPVKFTPIETMIIKVFFGDRNDINSNCLAIHPLERIIPRTQAVARASVEELLKGLSQEEKDLGYFNLINPDAKLQKITIENGIAYVDFNEELQRGVAGSCVVTAIRSQITNTLTQFPTVKKVVISINGRTEDILQP